MSYIFFLFADGRNYSNCNMPLTYRMLGVTDNGGKHGSWSIVSGESNLARFGSIVNN